MNPLGAVLLAHQGGWDEILFVLGPILLIGGLLVLARKRVGQTATRSTSAPIDDSRPTKSS